MREIWVVEELRRQTWIAVGAFYSEVAAIFAKDDMSKKFNDSQWRVVRYVPAEEKK